MGRRVFRGAATIVLSLVLAGAAFAGRRSLPSDVELALKRAQIPPDSLTVVVQDPLSERTRLSWRSREAVNPASLIKLLTTYAALELLGPAWTWSTPVWLQGPVQDGVLDGDLIIKGTGDPKLVFERVWLLLRRVQQSGVREIRGDIVLDRSVFVLPQASPADFDGEPLRPYNVHADALLVNYKSLLFTFTPDAARGKAGVTMEPSLAGVQVDSTVALSNGPCDDWRGALKADFTDPLHIRFAGSFPVACAERVWPVAHADPRAYNARAIEALWRELGGRLTGTVRDGASPGLVKPSFEVLSPPLADLVRDINKHSNNVMAQQLFLTLGLVMRGAGTLEASRATVRQWLVERLGEAAGEVLIDNGSGLSRDTRISADALARLLALAWASPVMPELLSSLPVIGLDGTLRRSTVPQGRAHLKTGSLRDVAGVAGYVLGASGRRYVLVAIVNHPNANAARGALDALVQWTGADQ